MKHKWHPAASVMLIKLRQSWGNDYVRLAVRMGCKPDDVQEELARIDEHDRQYQEKLRAEAEERSKLSAVDAEKYKGIHGLKAAFLSMGAAFEDLGEMINIFSNSMSRLLESEEFAEAIRKISAEAPLGTAVTPNYLAEQLSKKYVIIPIETLPQLKEENASEQSATGGGGVPLVPRSGDTVSETVSPESQTKNDSSEPRPS